MTDKQDESNEKVVSLKEKMVKALTHAVNTAPNEQARQQAQKELDKLIKQNK